MLYKLAATALCLQGALAGPNNHRRHGHARREAMQYDNPNWTATVDWNAVCANGACAPGASAAATSAPSVPAPVVKAEAQVTSAVSQASSAVSQASSAAAQYGAPSSSASPPVASSGSSPHVGAFSVAGFGSSSGPGSGSGTWLNIGEYGSPPGSNIIQVQDGSAYQFTNTFHNNMGTPRSLVIWNKTGLKNGVPDPNLGQFQTPAIKATIPQGGSLTYAFMNNTQAVACDITGNENTPNAAGLPNCAWLEMNMVDPAMSGIDVSLIQLQGGTPCAFSVTNQGQTITSCTQKVFNSDKDSDSNSAGFGGNGQQVSLQTTFG